jgi:hypothetical protein
MTAPPNMPRPHDVIVRDESGHPWPEPVPEAILEEIEAVRQREAREDSGSN